jgi:hypothetical protein
MAKILEFKSKNGEPVPIYIKTIKGNHIYKIPFQLPDDIGKYIQDFLRASSDYIRFSKVLYKRLHFRMFIHKYPSSSSRSELYKNMLYVMRNYKKWLVSRNTPLHKKWIALRKDPSCKRDILEKAKIEMNKELKDVFGFDFDKLGL